MMFGLSVETASRLTWFFLALSVVIFILAVRKQMKYERRVKGSAKI